MPIDFKINVKLKQNRIRWNIWYSIAWLLGPDIFLSEFIWWFLEPVVVNVGETGWKPVKYRLIAEATR